MTIQNHSGPPNLRPRIGIDLHVADGIFQGSRTHCLELFSRVIALTPECDFFALAEDSRKLLSFSHCFGLPNVTHVSMPEKAAPIRLLWQLPRAVQRWKLSLLHTQYVAPPALSCATAVTVHDVLFESHPQYFEKSFVLRSRLLVPSSIRRSAAVFSVSEFSRRQICDAYSIPTERVHTIPNGVDSKRFFPGDIDLKAVRDLGLENGAYFLTVGRLEPRKNHATMLRAWAQLKAPRPRLVLVGQRHFRYAEVFELIRSLDLAADVQVLEQVSDTQLPALYRNAKGFVYTSWAEGFGMPLLEAMASGIPVVTSANTALTEVSADAAIFVDPNDPTEISNAITALEQQPGLRKHLIDRGLVRIKEFAWEQPALVVRDAYLLHFGLTSGHGRELNIDAAQKP